MLLRARLASLKFERTSHETRICLVSQKTQRYETPNLFFFYWIILLDSVGSSVDPFDQSKIAYLFTRVFHGILGLFLYYLQACAYTYSRNSLV